MIKIIHQDLTIRRIFVSKLSIYFNFYDLTLLYFHLHQFSYIQTLF